MAIVPCPAITSGSSNGWISTRPLVAVNSSQRAFASAKVSPASSTSAPSSRTASTLISGVVCGITISALRPRCRAENATPWAWLPALAVITPRAALVLGQVRHPVVRAAQLEGEDRLEILAFQEDLVTGPPRQPARRIERRRTCDVIDAAGQDQPQHRIGGHDVLSEQMSLSRPAAVTSAPAPGPLTTSGSLR